jgi:hypothetical protein
MDGSEVVPDPIAFVRAQVARQNAENERRARDPEFDAWCERRDAPEIERCRQEREG